MSTPESDKPIFFVVGNSRSGTTMLGRMLGKHSRVHKFPELHLFGPCVPHGEELKKRSREEVCRMFCWLLDVNERKFHATRTPDAYIEKAEALCEKHFIQGMDAWDVYAAFVHDEVKRIGKQVPSEDLPGNVFKLSQILQKFPAARIVHIVRDPRDVLLSQKNRFRRRQLGGGYVKRKEMLRFWANYHPVLISRLWNNAVRAGLSIVDPRITTVHFETLIQDPENTLRGICTHLGISFEADMLRVPQVGSSMRKDDPTQLGIDPARSGSWNKGGLSHAEIAICEEANARIMQEMGYILSGVQGKTADRLHLALLLPVKGLLALLLNWGRTRGRWDYILKRFRAR